MLSRLLGYLSQLMRKKMRRPFTRKGLRRHDLTVSLRGEDEEGRPTLDLYFG